MKGHKKVVLWSRSRLFSTAGQFIHFTLCFLMPRQATSSRKLLMAVWVYNFMNTSVKLACVIFLASNWVCSWTQKIHRCFHVWYSIWETWSLQFLPNLLSLTSSGCCGWTHHCQRVLKNIERAAIAASVAEPCADNLSAWKAFYCHSLPPGRTSPLFSTLCTGWG